MHAPKLFCFQIGPFSLERTHMLVRSVQMSIETLSLLGQHRALLKHTIALAAKRGNLSSERSRRGGLLSNP